MNGLELAQSTARGLTACMAEFPEGNTAIGELYERLVSELHSLGLDVVLEAHDFIYAANVEPEKQYWLFSSRGYEQMGGFDDFIMAGTIDECKTAFDNKWNSVALTFRDEWGQIVDSEMRKVVLEINTDPSSGRVGEWSVPI